MNYNYIPFFGAAIGFIASIIIFAFLMFIREQFGPLISITTGTIITAIVAIIFIREVKKPY